MPLGDPFVSDPFTMECRLCDDNGWVSNVKVEKPNMFDPDLTYLKQINNLRAHTGLPPVDEFMCSGSAHLAREHILCTSPAHKRSELFHRVVYGTGGTAGGPSVPTT